MGAGASAANSLSEDTQKALETLPEAAQKELAAAYEKMAGAPAEAADDDGEGEALDLSDKGLTELPLDQLSPNLTQLEVYGNKLKALPEDVLLKIEEQLNGTTLTDRKWLRICTSSQFPEASKQESLRHLLQRAGCKNTDMKLTKGDMDWFKLLKS